MGGDFLKRWLRPAAVAGVLATASMLAGPPAAGAADGPIVAVAANAQTAMEEIAEAFRADTGHTVRLVFGASGNLARQIMQGAPFEMILSADEAYVRELDAAGLTRDAGILYGRGRVVLLVGQGSPLQADGSLDDLAAAIADGRLGRFAIANPDHAPYGRAAKEVLESRGLWEALQPRLVFGENVGQAAQFVTSGNAQGGIVAYSLALIPAVAQHADHALLPAEWHLPLDQRAALMKDAGETAGLFYEYVQSAPARAIFEKYGFVLPE